MNATATQVITLSVYAVEDALCTVRRGGPRRRTRRGGRPAPAPRSPQESALGDGLLSSVLLGGLCVAAVVLAPGVTGQQLGRPWQSVMFVVLGLAQLGVAIAVRAAPGPGRSGNRWLLVAVGASGVLQVAGVLLPPLRDLIGTETLSAIDLAACAAAAVVPGPALRVVRRFGT